MGLVSQAIWWGGDLMLACILWRCHREKLVARYPYFFGFVAWALCSALLRVCFYLMGGQIYKIGYWSSEFVLASAGFCVTWEIYSQILGPYRGVRTMARFVLGVLFTLVLAKAVVEVWATSAPVRPTILELERDLRVLQAILMVGIVGIIAYYKLPMGGNIRWMLVGYGFYLGCVIVTLTLRAQIGLAFQNNWDLLQRSGWCIMLAIWCAGMWSYSANPVPNSLLQEDYARITARTSRALGQLRTHLTQSWRA